MAKKKPNARQTLELTQRQAATDFEVTGHGHYDVPHGHTPDEKHFPRFAASFHKLLEHEPTAAAGNVAGLLTDAPGGGSDNYKELLDALMTGAASSGFDTAKFNGLKLQNRIPRPRVLIDPRASKALAIEGPDPVSLDVSRILYGAHEPHRLLKEISLSSEETAAEIVELYAMALLRLRDLGDYVGSADAALAVAALNGFGAKFVWGYDAAGTPITAATHPVTAANLFRGPSAGDQGGDYLSAFLTTRRPPQFPSGCSPDVADLIGAGQFAALLADPLLVPLGRSQWFGVTLDQYVRIQNAEVPAPYPAGFFSGRTPIQTGRDIGNYVHVDNAYEEHVRAVDILAGNQLPLSSNSPYSAGPAPHYTNEGAGPTLGAPDAWGLLGVVRIAAERAAFAQKWLVARRARPEVMAGLIHLAMAGNTDLVGPHKLDLGVFNRPEVKALLDRVQQDNRDQQAEQGLPDEPNYLLSQMFPEGSPAHPAWPSDHATIAGACVTVIKAIFDDCAAWLVPETGQVVVVGRELDKLASNIALARSFAGVHYRSDGEHGIRLGEEVAIRCLQDHARTYREEFRHCHPPPGGVGGGFTLTKRDGTRVCITPDRIDTIDSCPEAAASHEELQERFRDKEARRFHANEIL